MKKFLEWLKSSKSDFSLFVIFLILINFVSYNGFKKIDLTEAKSFSLSKASKSLVKNLEEPLTVRVFFDDDLPAPYNNVGQYVQDLLEEYKSAGNKNFSVHFMDMSKEENKDMAESFGIRQVQDQIVKNNEVSVKLDYRGLVITYGDSVKVMDPIESTDSLEYTLTSVMSKMIHSADLLSDLAEDEKVTVTLYFTDALEAMDPQGCADIQQVVKDAYDKVNVALQERLVYDCVTIPQDKARDVMNKYGLNGFRIKESDDSISILSLGLVVSFEENFKVLPVELQNSIFGWNIEGLETLQENLTDSIQALVSKPAVIAYVTGHGEPKMEGNPQQEILSVLQNLVKENYSLVNVNLKEENLPYGINSIIINGPQTDFTDEELYKIDQFVMRGGNLLCFIDPMRENEGYQYGYGTMFEGNENNLDKLLNKYGVKRELDVVYDDECYKNPAANVYYSFAPILQKGQLPKNHPITKNLGYVLMYCNGPLDITAAEQDKNVKATVLAESSEKSWSVPAESAYLSTSKVIQSLEDNPGPHNLAVLLEGYFNSAFNGPVSSEEDSFTAHSVLPGKVAVYSSSAITISGIVDGRGRSASEMLVMNTIDYLNGNEDLCTMRTKGLSVNVLDVKSKTLAAVLQYFNEFGLAVLVAVAGLIVWKLRSKRREQINQRYNPDDKRRV